jgi:hypothetical protein
METIFYSLGLEYDCTLNKKSCVSFVPNGYLPSKYNVASSDTYYVTDFHIGRFCKYPITGSTGSCDFRLNLKTSFDSFDDSVFVNRMVNNIYNFISLAINLLHKKLQLNIKLPHGFRSQMESIPFHKT